MLRAACGPSPFRTRLPKPSRMHTSSGPSPLCKVECGCSWKLDMAAGGGLAIGERPESGRDQEGAGTKGGGALFSPLTALLHLLRAASALCTRGPPGL